MNALNNMKKAIINYFQYIIFFIVSGILLISSTFSPFNPICMFTDSSVFMYIGKQLGNGLLPYRDLFDHKGPIIYLINYIGSFVPNELGIYIIETVFFMVGIIFCYKMIRLFASKTVSIASSIIAYSSIIKLLEGGNLVEEYALPFMFISLYIFTKYFIKNERINGFGNILIGICCATVFFLRQNMIALWIVFVPAVIIKIFCEKGFKESFKSLVLMGIGFFSVILPFVIFFLLTNTLQPFFDSYFVFNFSYISVNYLEKITAFQFFIKNNLLKVSIFALSILFISSKRKYRLFLIISILYLFLSYYLLSLSGRIYLHYALVLIPPLSIFVGMSFDFFESIVEKFIKNRKLVVASILIISSAFYIYAFKSDYNAIYKILQRQIFSTQCKNTIKDISYYIEKEVLITDKITVVGNFSRIYLVSNSLSASKYFYQFPISEVDNKIAHEYIEDINREKPKYIFLNIEVIESEGYVIRKMMEILENNYKFIMDSDGFLLYKLI